MRIIDPRRETPLFSSTKGKAYWFHADVRDFSNTTVTDGPFDGTTRKWNYYPTMGANSKGGAFVTLRFSVALLLAFQVANCATIAQPEAFDFKTVYGLYYPYSITVDASNDVFICESGQFVIRQLKKDGTNFVLTTIAGQPGKAGSVDGTNSEALFSGLGGIAPGPGGTLFVTDNETVRELVPFGTNWAVSTICGVSAITGSADGTNSDIRFSNPHGIAVDKSGAVYVADFENFTIRRMIKVGTNWISSTIVGLAKTSGMDNGTNTSARFTGPNGLAIDSAGTLYVTDHLDFPNFRDGIRVVRPIGTNWVVSDIPNFSTGDVPDFVFTSASGLTVGPQGQLYVASPASSTILEIAPKGTNMVMSILAGSTGARGYTDGTNTDATFNGPYAVALDKAGNLLVLDGDGPIRYGTRLPPPPPTITNPVVGDNSFEAQWLGSLGSKYSVQYSPNLGTTSWTNIGSTITATNELISLIDFAPILGHRFYRVILIP